MFKKTEGFHPVELPPPLPELERAGRGSAGFSPAKLALSHLSLARAGQSHNTPCMRCALAQGVRITRCKRLAAAAVAPGKARGASRCSPLVSTPSGRINATSPRALRGSTPGGSLSARG